MRREYKAVEPSRQLSFNRTSLRFGIASAYTLTKENKMSRYLKAFLIASLALVCLSLVPVSAQVEHGRMIKRFALPSDPVDKITPQVGGKAIRLNGVFNAGHDWLKGLKVRLRNRSGKNIIFAEVFLNIPKSGTMPLPFAIPVRYGQPPALDVPPEVSPVRHGEVFELSLSDNAYDTTMNYLAEHQVNEVVGVEMSNFMIVYDDDTAWGDGVMFRRDRTRPLSWKSSGSAKPVDEDKPADDDNPPRQMFQHISFTKPARYSGSLAVDDVTPFDYYCASFFTRDYALCGETLGNFACTALEESGRDNDPDENPLGGERKAVVKKIAPCEGLACSGKTKSVDKAQYDFRCGYSGGNEWQ